MTQIKAIVGLIGLNCGTSGSVMMVNESDLKATRTESDEMDKEKVISIFEKIISVCKEDGCDFVDLTFEDAEQILVLLKEQEHKDRMFHALEDDWKRLKELLKEQEAVIEQYHKADTFLEAHGWSWEGR